MSEYIIGDELDVLRQWMPKLTEIVRCRDCKHSDRSYWCKRWGMYGDLPSITPDGFCAWGERRDA